MAGVGLTQPLNLEPACGCCTFEREKSSASDSWLSRSDAGGPMLRVTCDVRPERAVDFFQTSQTKTSVGTVTHSLTHSPPPLALDVERNNREILAAVHRHS
jgi:hypothetical protein